MYYVYDGTEYEERLFINTRVGIVISVSSILAGSGVTVFSLGRSSLCFLIQTLKRRSTFSCKILLMYMPHVITQSSFGNATMLNKN